MTDDTPVSRLETYLDSVGPPAANVHELGDRLQRMVNAGLDRLPLPGKEEILSRWRALAAVAAHDLALVKLFEGHTDALAIMAELNSGSPPADSIWGMWAAEPPYARLTVNGRPGPEVELNGRKAWCSGARVLSHALLTAWNEDGKQQLVKVPLCQSGVRVTQEGWQAVGMQATDSVEVVFEHARGLPVGAPGEYIERPGFWHGGAGIAACWYGAAATLAAALKARVRAARHDDAHSLAHLGAVDAALSSGAAGLRECAAWIDRFPARLAARQALQARAATESTVEAVIRHVGRALGAAPFCRDIRFARLMADLPVFIRQSHAERDLAALGKAVAEEPAGGWRL